MISELSNLKVYNLTLEVTTPGYESWLTSVDPPYYNEVITGTSVTFNETIYVPIDASPGLHTFVVSAIDEDGVNYGNQTNEIYVNAPPNVPTNESPTNGTSYSTGNRPSSISWTGGDIDNDTVTYTVYLRAGNSTLDDTHIQGNTTDTSYIISTSWSTTYYWKIKATDEHGASTDGPVWHFTTGAEKIDGGGGSVSYYPPTADAGGPYYGFVDEEIEFDGTDSKDNDESGKSIEQYDWKFFDEDVWHEDIGANPTHTYNATGDYTVTLKVTDDEGKTDTDEITVTIAIANNPLTIITAEGTTTGDVNKEYTYTVNSTDSDSNDTVIYTFDWGDETLIAGQNMVFTQ